MKPSLPSVHSRIDQVASCRFWHPPPQNFLKCNVDTAFFNHARMCWLLKREKLSASWMRCAGFDLWGYRRVILEVDAKSTLNSMAMERTDLSELHSIVSLCGGYSIWRMVFPSSFLGAKLMGFEQIPHISFLAHLTRSICL